VSTSCTGTGDEHFAFDPDANGRWYIGIDDGETGGGQYMLSAFRLNCGDNMEIHGEGCDDGNLNDGDGCDRHCRVEVSEARAMEIEPNDNHIEANALVMPASNELIFTGVIAGPGACTYADTFAVTLPDQADLQVDALNADGTACASGSLTPYDLSLENSAGETVLANMEDTSGCSIIRATNQEGGTYFVRVSIAAETDTPSNYRLRVRVLP
jgi:cysteine-rich repeat protein